MATTAHRKPGTARRSVLRPELLRRPASVAALLAVTVLAVAFVIEHFEARLSLARERTSAREHLSAVRARIEGVVNANLMAVHGLSAVVASHPDIDQAEFGRIARGLFDGRLALRDIAGAPNLVIALIYPLEENAKAIGLDYRDSPSQRIGALRAAQTGQAVLAGPLQLQQGGIGILARDPVFVPGAKPGDAPRFWGLITAVIDIERLYRLAGLDRQSADWRVAIRGTDGSGELGAVFYGDEAVFSQDPVTEDVSVPGGHWRMAAVPPSGWARANADLWLIRLLGLLFAATAGAIAFRAAQATLENRRAAKVLRRQRDTLDRTSRLAKVGGWQIDVPTMTIYGDSETARIHEMDAGAPVSVERVLKTFRAKERAIIEQAIAAAIAHEQPFDLELELPVQTGAQKWVRTLGLPVAVEGRVARIEGATQDVTKRKMTEALLETQRQSVAESEARYRHLFHHNPAPVMIYACEDLNLLAVNDAFLRFYGYDAEEAMGLNLVDLQADGDRLSTAENVRREAEFANVGEREHVRKDGSAVTVEIHCGGIEYQGRPARIAVITDITERKRMERQVRGFNVELEERVRQRTAELAAANKELETFTYSVSHDLKAPLRGIDGYSRLLLEDCRDKLDGEAKVFLLNIRKGVEQMSRLIEDLLAYSRADRRSLRRAELSLAELIKGALAVRQGEIAACGTTVQVELGPDRINADPDACKMVLGNLIDNAIKFSRGSKTPTVEIRSIAQGDAILLSIRDNGIGFDMRFHDRIFEIFHRLQRSEDFPGTGIGLAIVRKAVQRLGGRIWAQSAPGMGATFFWELHR